MKLNTLFSWLLVFSGLVLVTSCGDDDPIEVISGFSYKADAADFLTIKFTNASSNATSYTWDFGDNSATSTEESPSHKYAAVGSYTVKLTAKASDGGTDISTQVVTVVDPDAELTKLTGLTSKTWKLLRVVSPGRWPLEVGPIARDQVWWAQGRDNDEIARRPCIMNDEFIFSRDKGYEYKTNGDYWAEGGVFKPANDCLAATAANMKGENGEDLTAFGDGKHKFNLVNGTKPTLTVIGKGAFIGLPKIGTVTEVKTPQDSVKYDILKLSDGAVDTLIIESKWKFSASNPSPDAYWKITLVHYDNPGDEPAIPSPKPTADFSFEATGLDVAFTNKSVYATTYSWDFGDGASSSAQNPSHTYSSSGAFQVKLTATSATGTSTVTKEVAVSDGSFTLNNLVGKAWKVRPEANSVYVGPALGSSEWWQVPKNFFDGSSTGTDDWSCMTNDEFIFNADGSYEYKTNGDARNDGYMGTPNGCWSDSQIATSGNGAAFGSGKHTFTLTPATGTDRPIITVKNGGNKAAFIGFYKGYYGGENTDGTKAPNGGSDTNRYEVMSYINSGGQEILVVSVDISDLKNGTKAWTMVLIR